MRHFSSPIQFAEHRSAAGADGKYRFVGLSLSEDGLKDYVRDKHLTYPVYVAKRGSGVQEKLGVRGTPQTLVASSAGVAQNVWFGAYGGKSRKEIARSLGVTLPVLKEE